MHKQAILPVRDARLLRRHQYGIRRPNMPLEKRHIIASTTYPCGVMNVPVKYRLQVLPCTPYTDQETKDK